MSLSSPLSTLWSKCVQYMDIMSAEYRFDPRQSIGYLAIALPGQQWSARVPSVELERAVHRGAGLARGRPGLRRRGEFPAGCGPDHLPGTATLAVGGERHDGAGRTAHPVKRAGQRVRRRGQDRGGERCAERRAPRGVADLLLVDVPLHVLASHIEPDRCRSRTGCPRHRAASGVEVQRGHVLLETQASLVDQLDEQGGADPPRRLHPLLVETVEPGVEIFSRGGALPPAVPPHRDVAEL